MRALTYQALNGHLMKHWSEISPGLRFGLFYRGWTEEDFKPVSKEKRDAVESVCELGKKCVDLLNNLRARQSYLASSPGSGKAVAFDREVFSQAPFVTGMGLEHPLENGFSFLHPYGLPYLPGSSVKGVVRRAAEELALFEPEPKSEEKRWDIVKVWWLFGFDSTSGFFQSENEAQHPAVQEERQRWLDSYIASLDRCNRMLAESLVSALPNKEDRERWNRRPIDFLKELPKPHMKTARQSLHIRGALRFWDVYPKPPQSRLRVDIMNPHYNHYYQGDSNPGKKILPPGDWGTPNPIYFLTMPAGTSFHFIVEYEPALKPSVPGAISSDGAKALLGAAMDFAFSWLGFGANTSIGYGLMGSEQPPVPKILSQAPAAAEVGLRGELGHRKGAEHRGTHGKPGGQPSRPPREEQKKSTSHHFPPPPSQTKSPTQPTLKTERATLVTEVLNGKATVRMADGTQVECVKIPEYPKQPHGSKCRVKVTYDRGKPVKIIFDRWES